jgi:hypothetical protein
VEPRGEPVVSPKPEEPAAEPPPIPTDPAKAWRAALRGITRHQAVMIEENAAFGAFIDGTLFLNVRQDRWRSILQEHLREVDFVSYLPGFRRWELRLAEGGRTGREARTQEDERRAVTARAAVAASPIIARLVAALGGRVDYVEASMLGGEEHPLDLEPEAAPAPTVEPPMEDLEE